MGGFFSVHKLSVRMGEYYSLLTTVCFSSKFDEYFIGPTSFRCERILLTALRGVLHRFSVEQINLAQVTFPSTFTFYYQATDLSARLKTNAVFGKHFFSYGRYCLLSGAICVQNIGAINYSLQETHFSRIIYCFPRGKWKLFVCDNGFCWVV